MTVYYEARKMMFIYHFTKKYTNINGIQARCKVKDWQVLGPA